MLSSRIWSLSRSPVMASVKPLLFGTTSVRHRTKKPMFHWPNDWLPFEWDYPEKVPGFFNTGDPKETLHGMEDFSKVYRPGFEFLEERDDVPESVKKLYRLENAYRVEQWNHVRRKRNKPFQRHPYDNESHEVMIANYTTKIRLHQELVYRIPNHVMSKIYISLFTSKRNRRLNELFEMDEARYHALVKGLGIKHDAPVAGVKAYGQVMRKKSLRELTDAYCHNIKKTKLEDYHEKLKAQQQPFLDKKEETLKWIEDEMKKYHITEDDLNTGFKPRAKYRNPHPVRPLVQSPDFE